MSVQAIPLMLADADKKLSKGDDSSHPYGQLERERGNEIGRASCRERVYVLV